MMLDDTETFDKHPDPEDNLDEPLFELPPEGYGGLLAPKTVSVDYGDSKGFAVNAVKSAEEVEFANSYDAARRRELALNTAVQVSAANATSETVLKKAKEFESYLAGAVG